MSPRARSALAVALVVLFLAGVVALVVDRREDRGRFTGPFADATRATSPPGTPLPEGAACAARVHAERELRVDNDAANHAVVQKGVDATFAPWGPETEGMHAGAAALSDRIDGDFQGTTDEIVQWAACKWGFATDIVRAVAVVESGWHQSRKGDAVGGVAQSFGILQIKRTAHRGTYPASERSTAWNLDYALAYRRACYEGLLDWLREQSPAYAAGDEWGCVGHWYSGAWHDDGAEKYVAEVRRVLDARPWTAPGF